MTLYVVCGLVVLEAVFHGIHSVSYTLICSSVSALAVAVVALQFSFAASNDES